MSGCDYLLNCGWLRELSLDRRGIVSRKVKNLKMRVIINFPWNYKNVLMNNVDF